MKSEIILIGGGGHCRACIDVIEQEDKYTIGGIVDLPDKVNEKILGYKIIASDSDLPLLLKEYKYFLIALGQIKSAVKRVEIFRRLKNGEAQLPVIRSPLAYISGHTAIGEGSIIMHHAVVNAGAKVGKNCIVNTKALVEHDAEIGDHCHISTGAIINGGVRMRSGSFFGSNAVSHQNVTIGKNSVVGCHALVDKNVVSDSIIK